MEHAPRRGSGTSEQAFASPFSAAKLPGMSDFPNRSTPPSSDSGANPAALNPRRPPAGRRTFFTRAADFSSSSAGSACPSNCPLHPADIKKSSPARIRSCGFFRFSFKSRAAPSHSPLPRFLHERIILDQRQPKLLRVFVQRRIKGQEKLRRSLCSGSFPRLPPIERRYEDATRCAMLAYFSTFSIRIPPREVLDDQRPSALHRCIFIAHMGPWRSTSANSLVGTVREPPVVPTHCRFMRNRNPPV